MSSSTVISIKPVAEVVSVEQEKLALIQSLLFAFHESGIRYCHWKSNEHLGASMTGDTDLDILFDNTQKQSLLRILEKLGFKFFQSIPQKQYRDIEDFIGLDLPSGKIVHLHAHFQLTLGEPYLKSYQLPFVDVILNTRIYDSKHGIYCIQPVYEYILLFIRLSLKVRTRDFFNTLFKSKMHFTGNLLREYDWLKERCSTKEMREGLKIFFKAHHSIFEIINAGFDQKQILQLSKIVQKEFKTFQSYSKPEAIATRWYREFSYAVQAKLHKWFSIPIIKKRVNPRSGLSIALIGADGSGKSTVVKQLIKTFEKKIDVYHIYFGKGSSGKKSKWRRLLIGTKQLLSGKQKSIVKIKSKENRGIQKSSGRKTFFKEVYECIQALLIAIEKERNIRKMQVLTQKGGLVICDRFPQNQVMNMNDGPVLQKYELDSRYLFKAFSNWERSKYAFAEKHCPQLIFRLHTDLQTSLHRKPGETPENLLAAKIEGIHRIQFSGACNVIDIDATKPLHEVLFYIKKEIWRAML